MSRRDFVGCIEAKASMLTDEQRADVLAFAAAHLRGCEDRIEAIRKQHDFERRWEEELLGRDPAMQLEFARRGREP